MLWKALVHQFQQHLHATAGPKIEKWVLVLLVGGLPGAVPAARPPQDLAPSLLLDGELVVWRWVGASGMLGCAVPGPWGAATGIGHLTAAAASC